MVRQKCARPALLPQLPLTHLGEADSVGRGAVAVVSGGGRLWWVGLSLGGLNVCFSGLGRGSGRGLGLSG